MASNFPGVVGSSWLSLVSCSLLRPPAKRWWAAGWLSWAGWFDSCLVASCRKVVSASSISVVWCLGWPMAEKWDGFEHSVVRLAHGELLSSSPPLVNCFVPNVSLLRHSSSAHGWDKHGYNGSFFWSLPMSFLVVIETLWVLCNCLMTHSFCVWAGGLCFSTVYWWLLKWSLLVSSGKFLFQSSVVPSIGLHLLWDANYCICAAEPYGPMVTWCCMYLSSNWQTWLILPVVICLSQRLSHACLSISFYTAKLRMAH